MKKIILMTMLFGCSDAGFSQQSFGARLTYTAKLTLQGYNIPFYTNHFSLRNLGAAFGVDYRYNHAGTVFQTFTIGLFSHKEHGNSYYFNTQLTYRPTVFKQLEPGVSIGVGRILSFANKNNPYYEMKGGSWVKSDRQFEGRWQVPIALSLGYKMAGPHNTIVTPFIGYEGVAVIKYNSAFGVLPYTLITVGSRIQIAKH